MPEPLTRQRPPAPGPSRPHRTALTQAQRGLWIGQQLDPSSPAYNTAEYVQIDGPVDADAFEAALRRTVGECEAVNVRFGADGDRPYQVAAPVIDWPLPVLDLRHEDDPDAAARAWMIADLDRLVDLTSGPLFAHALLQVGDRRFLWFHRVHHIALDGYGLALFARRVADVYTALLSGAPVPASPFAPLSGVLAEEAGYLDGPRWQSDREFWTARFADRPDPATLADGADFAAQHALRVVTDLDPDVVQRLRAIARETATTWPDVFIGGVAGYLHRMTGAGEAVLALPVMNRLGTAGVRVPCTVLNVVPLRIRLDADAGIAELARRVAQEIRTGRPHHRYRYEDLQRDLKLLGGRRRLFGPAVNVMPFDYGLCFDGHRASVHNLSAGPVEDLSVAVYDRADGFGLRVILGANPARYTLDELRRHQQGLLGTLSAATSAPGRPVAAACPITPDAVLEGAALPVPGRPVTRLIADHAVARPDAPAVEHDGVTLTYAELLARSSELASRLRARGIGPDHHVALLYPHGIDAVVAILAVLEAGAGYVPLDPKARPGRWAHMLDVTGPSLILTDDAGILTDDAGARTLGAHAVPVLTTASAGAQAADPAGHAPDRAGPVPDADPQGDPQNDPDVDPAATAYVLFTSGSTGDPKAVAISHRALATYVAGAIDTYQVGPRDRALHFLPLHFDGHVEEVLVSLCSGATVVIRTEEMTQSLTRMVAGWGEHRASVLNLPTSYWHEVVHGLATGTVRVPECVRVAIIGGEAAAAERVRQWFAAVGGRVRLINTYGPTEATVVAVAVDLTPELVDDAVPIGRPFPAMTAVVLDDRGRLATPGTTGELYLVGDALATGYLARPDLDAARFPVLEQLPGRPRAYRTGDLVRRHRNGLLHFVGRVDDEFKISGHRVDPGEVEAVLLGCPGVVQAAVVGQVSDTGGRYLSAFMVAGDPAPTPAQVRAYVRERLPAALVPTVVQFETALPKTTSGKIDRASLRRNGRIVGALDDPPPGLVPQDEVQLAIMEVWREVLGVAAIGPDDDFFDLGGQSLQTIQVANRLTARFGREVTVATVFRYPTVADLAAELAPEGSAPGPGADPSAVPGAVPGDRGSAVERAVSEMLADAVLPADIGPPQDRAPAGPAVTTGRVLLTGATGFLGAHLLATLLARTRDRVVCLVRDEDEDVARGRLEAGLLAQGLPTGAVSDRVDVVLGDLARPGLGISPERFAQLADSCDAVYHNASVISVMRGYTSLRGVNVHGTRELVRLACVRGIPLHYLSTLNVAPPSGIAAEVPEDFLPAHAGLRDGYQQSKWAAERLVQQAAERGLPVSVYRLARLVGSPESGCVNPADLLWRVLLAGIPIGAIPRLYRADAWTPVDFVADAVVHLARTAATGVYNLVPYPELPLTDLCAWINDYGYRVTLESLPRWRSLLPDTAADLATTAFFDLWSGGEGTVDLEIGTVATANLDTALAGTRITCPRPDPTMMHRYLNHCVREGLLPAPGGDR